MKGQRWTREWTDNGMENIINVGSEFKNVRFIWLSEKAVGDWTVEYELAHAWLSVDC